MSHHDLNIRAFHPADEAAVIQLWHDSGLTRPWNDPKKDVARKLTVQPGLFLVGEAGGRIVAATMAGYDGHRGWINYLAVAPDCRRRGHASALMRAAERKLLELGCPKINLLIRAENATVRGFYESLGFGMDDVVSMGKRLIPDL